MRRDVIDEVKATHFMAGVAVTTGIGLGIWASDEISTYKNANAQMQQSARDALQPLSARVLSESLPLPRELRVETPSLDNPSMLECFPQDKNGNRFCVSMMPMRTIGTSVHRVADRNAQTERL